MQICGMTPLIFFSPHSYAKTSIEGSNHLNKVWKKVCTPSPSVVSVVRCCVFPHTSPRSVSPFPAKSPVEKGRRTTASRFVAATVTTPTTASLKEEACFSQRGAAKPLTDVQITTQIAPPCLTNECVRYCEVKCC